MVEKIQPSGEKEQIHPHKQNKFNLVNKLICYNYQYYVNQGVKMQIKSKLWMTLPLLALPITTISLITSCAQANTPSAFEAQRIQKGSLSFKSGSPNISQSQLDQIKTKNDLIFDYLKGFNFQEFKYEISESIREDLDGWFGNKTPYLKFKLKITNLADPNDVSISKVKIEYRVITINPNLDVLLNQIDQWNPSLKFTKLDQNATKTINNWIELTNQQNYDSQSALYDTHQKIIRALVSDQNQNIPSSSANAKYLINHLYFNPLTNQIELQFVIYLENDDTETQLFSQIKRFDVSLEAPQLSTQKAIIDQLIKNQWISLNQDEGINPIQLNQDNILENTNFEELANLVLTLDQVQVSNFNNDRSSKTITFMIKLNESIQSEQISLKY